MPHRNKKHEVMEYLKTYIDKHNYAPSMREIMEQCELKAISHAQYILKGLAADGKIERTPRISRGIVIKR